MKVLARCQEHCERLWRENCSLGLRPRCTQSLAVTFLVSPTLPWGQRAVPDNLWITLIAEASLTQHRFHISALPVSWATIPTAHCNRNCSDNIRYLFLLLRSPILFAL